MPTICVYLCFVLYDSTYSGKVFRVTFLSLGGFVFLSLLVIVFIFKSPIQPEVFRWDTNGLWTQALHTVVRSNWFWFREAAETLLGHVVSVCPMFTFLCFGNRFWFCKLKSCHTEYLETMKRCKKEYTSLKYLEFIVFVYNYNPTGIVVYCSLKEPPLMTGCWEPNLKLRKATRIFENQIQGPESIANIGGGFVFQQCSVKKTDCWRLFCLSADVLFTGTADGKIVKLNGQRLHTVTQLGKHPCGERKWLLWIGDYFHVIKVVIVKTIVLLLLTNHSTDTSEHLCK